MCDLTLRARQGDVYGVGMAAKVVASFEQCYIGQAAQRVCRGQPRNAGANDGDAWWFAALAEHAQPREYKVAAKRPGANEGGRREKERPGIASGPESGRLRNNETVFMPSININTSTARWCRREARCVDFAFAARCAR